MSTGQETRREPRIPSSQSNYTSQGTRTVVTTAQNGVYSSRLWVNCKPEVKNAATDLGDATLVCGKHRSEAGARKWAAKAVAR